MYRSETVRAKKLSNLGAGNNGQQPFTEDLDSLFFPDAGEFDKDVVNELITEHMVLDDPTNLREVIHNF